MCIFAEAGLPGRRRIKKFKYLDEVEEIVKSHEDDDTDPVPAADSIKAPKRKKTEGIILLGLILVLRRLIRSM